MSTAYIQRWTEDPHEDMEIVKAENDVFLDGRDDTAELAGLNGLHSLLT